MLGKLLAHRLAKLGGQPLAGAGNARNIPAHGPAGIGISRRALLLLPYRFPPSSKHDCFGGGLKKLGWAAKSAKIAKIADGGSIESLALFF